MMRSLWSGVAGLRTHQMEMDVIGNNISNVNTTAYKSQATGFQDILYQTVKEGTGAGETVGSTNISQVGLGSKVGSIYTNISAQGSAITTNNALDLMITGPSFFIISPDAQSGGMNYSRDGSFTIDANGDLVTQSNGYYVLGTRGDVGIGDGNVLQNLRVINRNRDMNGDGILETDYMEGSATSQAYLKGNIDRDDAALEEGRKQLLEVYGTDGEKYTISFKFTDAGDADDSTYQVTIDKVTDKDGNTVSGDIGRDLTLRFDKHSGRLESITPNTSYYTSTSRAVEDDMVVATNVTLSGDAGSFDHTYDIIGTDGKLYRLDYEMRPSTEEGSDYTLELKRVRDADGNTLTEYGTEEMAQRSVALDFDDTNGTLVSVGGTANKTYAFEFGDELPIGPVTFNFSDMRKMVYDNNNFVYNLDRYVPDMGPLNVDFSNLTNYAGKFGNHSSTINAYQGDTNGLNKGYAGGVLTGVSFTDNGSVYGTYSNGQTIKKGQIAVAEFANAMGLEKVGDNLYQASLNSGNARVIDITSTGGYMNSGVLEGSNVDLAKEFTDMITTQRGFQANSRVITTSDEMLQILKGLKR